MNPEYFKIDNDIYKRIDEKLYFWGIDEWIHSYINIRGYEKLASKGEIIPITEEELMLELL